MLRITGGEFRGREIRTPSHDRTRPTQAKLRQALFNSLQAAIPDAQVLDLFSGSGSLGFEALSRGAREVVFVECSKPVCQLIDQNATALGVKDRTHVVHDLVDHGRTRILGLGPYDLVMADPPYSGGFELKLLQAFPWDQLLNPGGYLCLEWAPLKSMTKELPDQVPFLVKVREKNYGDSVLTTYCRKEQ